MKIIVLLGLLAICHTASAQVGSKFDSVYTEVIALVKQWESQPLEIYIIKERNFSSGRKTNLSVTLKHNPKDNRIQKRRIKIRYSKSGIRFEKIKIFVNGNVVGRIKKMNDTYLFVEMLNLSDRKGNEFIKAIIVENKYILLKNKNMYLTKYYWKQESLR